MKDLRGSDSWNIQVSYRKDAQAEESLQEGKIRHG